MGKTKLAFISDIHYYSPALGTEGRAYELRSGSDQKCLAESGAVVDAAFDLLRQSDVDAVVISGDITNNGERCSHEEMREKIDGFLKDKPLYLITSTHDWCTNGNPRRFVGNEVFHDVPALNAAALDAFYADIGEDKVVSSYENGHGFHSRCYQVSESLRLLAVNDDEALRAAFELTRMEGIIPALESSHALALLPKMTFKPTDVVVLTVSGRGDKDLDTYLKHASEILG